MGMVCNVINTDPEIMGGAPVFQGTRVPISTLFDYLSETEPESNPVEDFMNDFPSVTADQISQLLEHYSLQAAQSRRGT